jgi:hypothetical protein
MQVNEEGLVGFFHAEPYDHLPWRFYLALTGHPLPDECTPDRHCFTGMFSAQQGWLHVYDLSPRRR